MVRQDGPPLDRALAELADRQWGVVYAVGHRALRAEGRRPAAVLACGPGAVLSHRSAAAHWGLLPTDQVGIDVTAPATRHGIPGIRLHRPRSLDAQDTTNHQAIPITTVHRTLLDLAASTRADQLERALAQTMHLQLYDHRAITDVITRSNGHRGGQRSAPPPHPRRRVACTGRATTGSSPVSPPAWRATSAYR